MKKGIICLLYRKIIDAGSSKRWEKLVFDQSYAEFLMQAQFYNQKMKYSTFGELITHVPGAEKLHFLVSASIIGYVQQLNGQIPDILNNVGKHFLPFKNFRFEIINSDIRSKEQHQVAINFVSEPLTWYDTIGDRLLVGVTGSGNIDNKDGEVLTEVLSLQPFLSIYSLKEIS